MSLRPLPQPPAPPRLSRSGALLASLLLAAGLAALPPLPPEAAALDRATLARRFVADSTAAIACLNRGQADSALALVRPLVGAARGLGDSAMVARALLVDVFVDLRGARALEAEPKLLAAQRLAIAARDTGVWMRSLRAEGMTRNLRGDLAATDRIVARWQALAEATGNVSEQAWARSMSAWLAKTRGDLPAALAHSRWAEQRFLELDELPGLGFSRNEIGRILLADGEYEGARPLFTSALDIAERTGDPRLESWALANLGVIEMRIGDPVRGIALAERSIRGQLVRGELDGFLIGSSNLSLFAFQMGRLDQAMAFARHALAVAERESLAAEVPWQRMNLADAQWAAGRRDSARALWALVLADSVAEPAVRALTANSAAHDLADRDSAAAAAALLDLALARWGAQMEQEGRVQIEIFRAELDTRLGRPDLVRPRLLPVALRLDESGDTEFGLAAWMQIARADRLAGAPERAAASRAHALRLWEAGRARASSLEHRERRGEQGQLLLSETLVATPAADLAFAALQRFKTRALLERLARPGQPGAAAEDSADGAAFDAAAFRATTLREGELLLEYACSPDTTLLFAVTRGGIRRIGLPGARALASQLDLARAAFAGRPAAGDATAARLAASALGRVLLGDVADLVADHPRVLVAPDGVLHRVPFAALSASGSEAPLLAGRRVTLVPSAKFLARLRGRGAAPAAPGASVFAVSGGPSATGSLRGARAEVERLAGRFDGVTTRFARSDGAVELGVAELAGHRGLHFAGHSHADDQLPWRSGIVLGPGVGGDSLLTAAEIAAAPLDAGLVVLSSCESAGGRVRSGEGVSGLSSAFLVAGAPAVVATLWPVDDRVTADLMEKFYLALARGVSAGDALRDAQLELRGRAATAHPFYWAGFVLIGDGDVKLPLRTRALTAERAGLGIALGLVGLVLVLAFASRLRALRGERRGGRASVGILVVMAGLGATAPAIAQEPPGRAYAPAESAAVARASWARMREARAAGDRHAAVAHAARAHASWPGQWVYAYGLASVAAAAGDAGEVRRGLANLAALGAAPDLSPDTTLVSFARVHAAPELAQLERAAGMDTPSEVAFRFPEADSAFWPEGIACDTMRGEWYVTGVREGRIARLDAAGVAHPFARVAASGWSALGVGFDGAGDRVWVGAAALPQAAGHAAADSGRGAILAYDRATGREVARFDLPPAAEGHVPGDVLVTAGGDVFASDSGQPVIWRIRDGRLEEFAADPGFRSLQGQAMSPDGATLYVADYSHGLAAVDVATRAVTWLRPPEGRTTLGLDGMAWWGDRLVAVQNGLVPPRLVVIALDPAGRRIASVRPLARDRGQADEPTLLTASGQAGGGRPVYIANSQWEKHDAAGARRPGTSLSPPRGLFVPIR